MANGTDPLSEQERIRSVYHAWLAEERNDAYGWHRPEVIAQAADWRRVLASELACAFGPDLGQLRVVDVGCGTGGFLRQLIDWGANPALLAGTEYVAQRMAIAQARTAAGVRWHLGDLDFAAPGSFDLVCANTVFSSILEPSARTALAAGMWNALAPGGWCMVFDFRYNNPRNSNVRRVTRAELRSLWPASASAYRSLLLAPPIGRRLARAPRLVSELLTTFVPVLRSHFVYTARKG